MIYVPPSTTFEARVEGFPTGLTGTVGVQLLDNAGAVTTARVTAGITENPAGSGSYIVTMTAPATSGQYSIFWDTGTIGPSTTAAEDVTVTSTTTVVSASGSNYITRAALKATLTLTVATFDADIDAAITAASRAIDQICNRRFYPDADALQVRYYSPEDTMLLETADIVTLTSLKSTDDGTATFGNTWTLNTDFFLEPLNAASSPDGNPWTHIRAHPSGSYRFNTYFPRSVQVTGKFGWASVPGAVAQATTVLATRLFKTAREAPMGVLAYDGVAVRVARMDSTVMSLVGPLIRHRIAVS